jgi:hypothetical protein
MRSRRGSARGWGGVNATMEHVRGLMERETDPERMRYRQEQMRLLKAMSQAGAQ